MIKKFITIFTMLALFSCQTSPVAAATYRSYRSPVVIHRTVVVHHDNGNGAGGFIAGALIGHALSQPAVTQPVVVQPVQPVQTTPIVEPQVVQQPIIVRSNEHKDNGMLVYLLALLTVIGLGGFILVLHKQNKDKYNN